MNRYAATSLPRMKRAARSPIIIVGALVFPNETRHDRSVRDAKTLHTSYPQVFGDDGHGVGGAPIFAVPEG